MLLVDASARLMLSASLAVTVPHVLALIPFPLSYPLPATQQRNRKGVHFASPHSCPQEAQTFMAAVAPVVYACAAVYVVSTVVVVQMQGAATQRRRSDAAATRAAGAGGSAMPRHMVTSGAAADYFRALPRAAAQKLHEVMANDKPAPAAVRAACPIRVHVLL